jgi:hypothetical protein
MTSRSTTLIRLLPLFHICACAAILGPWPDLGVLFTIIDFPVSILVLTLAWRYDIHLVFAFGVLGTVWWLRCSPSFGPKCSLLKVDRCLQ